MISNSSFTASCCNLGASCRKVWNDKLLRHTMMAGWQDPMCTTLAMSKALHQKGFWLVELFVVVIAWYIALIAENEIGHRVFDTSHPNEKLWELYKWCTAPVFMRPMCLCESSYKYNMFIGEDSGESCQAISIFSKHSKWKTRDSKNMKNRWQQIKRIKEKQA